MGHKYRRKNKLRKQARAERRGINLPRLIRRDMERSMVDYFRRPNIWGTAMSSTSVEPSWHVKPNPTKPVSYDELMEWGKDPKDKRSIGDLVGMKP